jgi:peroxiredoxin
LKAPRPHASRSASPRNERNLPHARAKGRRQGARVHAQVDVGRRGQFAGRRNVLVAFFPLAFTSVCTTENCAFTDDYAAFESKETVVLPVSVDSGPTLSEFRAKHHMTHHLLSDFKREAGRAYGVLDEEKFYTKRAYFLIDKAGILRWKHVEAENRDSRKNEELLAEIARVQG